MKYSNNNNHTDLYIIFSFLDYLHFFLRKIFLQQNKPVPSYLSLSIPERLNLFQTKMSVISIAQYYLKKKRLVFLVLLVSRRSKLTTHCFAMYVLFNFG